MPKTWNENILHLLGSPAINVELSDEQLNTIKEVSENEAKELCRIYGCEELTEYITYKLSYINAKKTWLNVLSKYVYDEDCAFKINESYFLETIEDEERKVMNILEEFKK